MPDARVLLFDIETAPNISYTWGKYDQNVVRFEQEWFVLCFGYKWLGERGVNVVSLPDYPGAYKHDKADDYTVVCALRNLLDEADVVIAHNGDNFDIPKVRARLAVHDIDPPSPSRSIDTLKVARRYFTFNDNSLGGLGETLGLGSKGPTGGFDTWLGCMAGDEKAWRKMTRYCGKDVLLLEKVYLRLRKHMENHPNLALIAERPDACPKCGSSKGMIARRAIKVNSVTVNRYYQCKACAGYSPGRLPEDRVRPDYK